MRCNCGPLLDAINRYLTKADEDLEDQLKAEGFEAAEDTVSAINDLEEKLAHALKGENDKLLAAIADADTLEKVRDIIATWKFSDDISEQIFQILNDHLLDTTARLATTYASQVEPDVIAVELRRRTVAQIAEQTKAIAEHMKLTSHDCIDKILRNGLEEGKGISEFIADLKDSEIYDEYYRARRTAITEVLTANRAAANEAYVQSPVVEKKKWRHTGSYRNAPRKNHVAMDGTEVNADEAYELIGADGVTYYPMYPGDWSLPAAERINCHCISQPVVNKDILGLSLEERNALRQKIIDEDNERFSVE